MERWRKNKRGKQRRKEEKDGGREEKKDGDGIKKTRIKTHGHRSQKHLTTSEKISLDHFHTEYSMISYCHSCTQSLDV